MTPEGEKVLRAILSFGTGEDSFDIGGEQCQQPGAEALFALCEILARNAQEETLQQFLTSHPGFLMGLFGTGDGGDLAFLTKPRVGTKYIADFAIVQVFQGGAAVFLIEIETAHEPIFTSSLSPAKRLQAALTQVDEWKEWVAPNKLTFCRDIIDKAVSLPLYAIGAQSSRGFRFAEEKAVRSLWNAFGGDRDPHVHYGIIISRWSSLSYAGKQRFLTKFNADSDVSVYTYEQLARQAMHRRSRDG